MNRNREISNPTLRKLVAKSFTVLALCCTLTTQQALGQFTDDFSDGNFNTNPSWNGSTGAFTVNGLNQLQLNNTVATTSFLSVPFAFTSLGISEWQFNIRQTFSGSTTNFSRVYLMSDQQDLTSALNGYYLQFGETGSLDAVELFRQTGNTSTTVCRAPTPGIANTFNIRVKVSRGVTGLFELRIDYAGGTNFVLEASGTDNTHVATTHFGIRCTYTLTNATKFFYDDFVVTGLQAPDVTPPLASTITVQSSTEIDLLLSEPINAATAESILNYSILSETVNPVSAILQTDQRTVRITFAQAFTNGVNQQLAITNVKDLNNNVIIDVQKSFLFFQPVTPSPKDIIITELFPDFSPPVGLPEAEFIELHNRSQSPFDLSGWKITDGTSVGNLSSLLFLPGEYLILSLPSAHAAYASFGKAMSIPSFPSLNNSGDTIRLEDPQGNTIDLVTYSSSWYSDDDKKDGGWTLERIDPDDFCKGSANWTSSTNVTGGSPGTQNSVYAINPDVVGPKFLSADLTDSKILTLMFDEKLYAVLTTLDNFDIQPSITIQQASFSDETLSGINLTLVSDPDSATTYTITANDIHDCPGNNIQPAFSSFVLKLDTTLPKVSEVNAISQTELTIEFSEKLDEMSSQNLQNYDVIDFGSPASAVLSTDRKTITLTFSEAFINGKENVINIHGIFDPAANQMLDELKHFTFFQPTPPKFKDIVINEIFADPGPIVGLPETEFIELYNRSNAPFDLNGWKFSDGSTTALLSGILLPKAHLIICPSTKASQFSGFGKTLAVNSFPSLNNTGEGLTIKDSQNLLIDSIHYALSWYKNEEKKDGGWTLELIDPENVCTKAENWKSSEDVTGGTPGRQNSVFSYLPDYIGPRLISTSVISERLVNLTFDEKLSTILPPLIDFKIQPDVGLAQISFADVSLTKIDLTLSADLDSTITYILSASNIRDCPGNEIQTDFSESTLKLDIVNPEIVSLNVISSTEMEIQFTEKMLPIHSKNILNYEVLDFGNPLSVQLASDSKRVLLKFAQPFGNGYDQTIFIKDLFDLAANVLNPIEKHFMFFQSSDAKFKDVIITELFADPGPVIGLPETEFVEIYNRSSEPFDLTGWKFSDGTSTALLSGIILPTEYRILCLASKVPQFISFGKTIGINPFPSLNNSGDALILNDPSGLKVDSVNYSDIWYRDDEKKDGGWTLELIDPENTCAESENWTASENEHGGTPGIQNSVFANKPDLTGPVLISVVPISSTTLLLNLNEKLEKTLPGLVDFIFEPALTVSDVSFADASLTLLHLNLSEPLQVGIKYKLTAEKIYDCAGNEINSEFNKITFALPEKADSLDVLINEVLFNPRSTGVDFVEVYNPTTKFINLKNWMLANVDDDGKVVNRKVITEENFLLEPNAFAVFTEDGNILKGEYLQGKEEVFLNTDMPSYADDLGTVALLNNDSLVIDQFFYTKDMHSAFIKDDEGVSLERISLLVPTNDSQNWKSASSQSDFATPGYLNSNSVIVQLTDETVSIDPEIFVPLYGQPDFTQIKYNLDHGGYVANIKILDPQGREIKRLANNEILGAQGFLRWDGDQDNGSRARIGSYMVWFEVFDETGIVRTFRKRVVVAGKF